MASYLVYLTTTASLRASEIETEWKRSVYSSRKARRRTRVRSKRSRGSWWRVKLGASRFEPSCSATLRILSVSDLGDGFRPGLTFSSPPGFCYSRETLLAYCRFVEKHNLHLISDEIYALSTFTTPSNADAQPFVSLLSLDVLAEAGCCPSRVHAIYGASKVRQEAPAASRRADHSSVYRTGEPMDFASALSSHKQTPSCTRPWSQAVSS